MSEKSYGKRVKVPVHSIPKAHLSAGRPAGIWNAKLRLRTRWLGVSCISDGLQMRTRALRFRAAKLMEESANVQRG